MEWFYPSQALPANWEVVWVRDWQWPPTPCFQAMWIEASSTFRFTTSYGYISYPVYFVRQWAKV